MKTLDDEKGAPGAGAHVPMPMPLEALAPEEMERKRAIARVTTRALSHLTRHYVNEGFQWLLPTVLSKTTDPLWPDPGASIEKRLEVEIYGQEVRGTLSMIIHKMVACALAFPKLFILSPNLRIERRERGTTGVHIYEFTQLDFEMREAGAGEVQVLVEGALRGLLQDLRRHAAEELSVLGRHELPVPSAPFRRLDAQEWKAEHGAAWEARVAAAIDAPAWVTNIPREFYDYEDPETGVWDNYDLFLPGYGEVLSGAKREWEPERLLHKMERDDVEPQRYALLLDLARQGRLAPCAGAGIGLERLLAWVVGARHVGEVQPFPRVPGLVYDL